MAFFEWEESFRVGIAEIDQQHQRLVDLINQLHAAIERCNELATLASVMNELDAVTDVLGELISYAEYHFGTEERLMVDHKYPEYEQHRDEHQQFISNVQAYKQGFEKKKTRLSIEIVEFLVGWWRVHILGADKKCGAFVIAQA